MHAGSFRVCTIHRTLTWTSVSLTCVQDYSYACVYTRGLGTPTASQHNIFDSVKLFTNCSCAPDAGGVRTSEPPIFGSRISPRHWSSSGDFSLAIILQKGQVLLGATIFCSNSIQRNRYLRWQNFYFLKVSLSVSDTLITKAVEKKWCDLHASKAQGADSTPPRVLKELFIWLPTPLCLPLFELGSGSQLFCLNWHLLL